MGNVLGKIPLVAHPGTDHPDIAITVAVTRTAASLRFDYALTGQLNTLRLPAPTQAARRDGLWQHSCFEAFVRVPGAAAYTEFNFSPSSEWAAYTFADYRHAMHDLPVAAIALDKSTSSSNGQGQLALSASVTLEGWEHGPLLLALSAVIEEESGNKSYWALRHPSGPPDFHHPDCFALTLPAPDPA